MNLAVDITSWIWLALEACGSASGSHTGDRPGVTGPPGGRSW